MRTRRRVGLALGAGGVLGGAWVGGTLGALGAATGWSPAEAELLLGTSAGSVLAALLLGGVAAGSLLPSVGDEPPAAGGWPLADLARAEAYAVERRWPVPAPGSVGLVLRSARDRNVLRALSGLAPRGLVPTAAIEAAVRRAAPAGWRARPACWIVACDYGTGRRGGFGRADAPPPPPASAAAASRALPRFFRP